MAVAKNNTKSLKNISAGGVSVRLLLLCITLGFVCGVAFFVYGNLLQGWDLRYHGMYMAGCILGGLLFGILNYLLFSKLYLQSLHRVVDVIDAVGAGDLSAQCQVNGDINDVVGRIAFSVNRMSNNLRSNITSIAESTNKVSKAVSKLSVNENHSNQRQANGSVDRRLNSRRPRFSSNSGAQQGSRTQAAQSSTKPGSVSKPTSADSPHKKAVRPTQSQVQKSVKPQGLQAQVENADQKMQRLEKESKEINKVLDIIQNIAQQTHLLAMNAAIDAAKAGEQGRGFAVVADEVGALALRTHKSTLEIKQMIDQLHSGSSDVAKVMDAAVENVKRRMDKAPDNAARSSTSSREVAQETVRKTPVNRESTATQTSRMVERRAELPKNANQTHREISRLVEELRKAISLFKR
ncbi:MAG: hypothetical protein AMJ53_06605 [Gammaproteobacteria bacterium SG8_11]|nr:MAG: hypothetical protein AMJ53_06605 [Gammaproteobacteria bacterium SG8_11]